MGAAKVLKAIDWAYAQSLPPNRKLVLVTLACFRDPKTGRCDPAVATLAARTGMSKNGVRHSLKDLSARGLIRIDARRKGQRQDTNAYVLMLDGAPKEASGAGAACDDRDEPCNFSGEPSQGAKPRGLRTNPQTARTAPYVDTEGSRGAQYKRSDSPFQEEGGISDGRGAAEGSSRDARGTG